MESWSYPAEEKGYMISDEMDFSLEAFLRGKKALFEWDNKAKAACNFEKDEFSSDGEGVKSMEVVNLGFHDLFQNELGRNYSKRANSSTHVIGMDSSLVEEESQSKHSGSLVESRSPNSSLIDLKLGRVADCKDASNDKIAKRARISGSPAKTHVCQVYGCNMDLSSSKEYHKRHKVCDAHSKTAKVIVNGIEQRFCQQCSRFHLLAEFDGAKRSCRRRLAGHNERRRKPQFDYMTGKPYKMLQLHQATKYLEASFQRRTQFAFQDMIGSGIFHSGKYEQTNLSDHMSHGQEELSRASSTACALSLLSVQSQNPLCHSAENRVASSPFYHSFCMNHSNEQVSKIPFWVNSVDKYVQNESSSRRVNSMEVIKNGSMVLSDIDRAPHFQVHRDNMCQPSDLSPEDGATVDLFQLSSHLQRVEHQRNPFLQ